MKEGKLMAPKPEKLHCTSSCHGCLSCQNKGNTDSMSSERVKPTVEQQPRPKVISPALQRALRPLLRQPNLRQPDLHQSTTDRAYISVLAQLEKIRTIDDINALQQKLPQPKKTPQGSAKSETSEELAGLAGLETLEELTESETSEKLAASETSEELTESETSEELTESETSEELAESETSKELAESKEPVELPLLPVQQPIRAFVDNQGELTTLFATQPAESHGTVSLPSTHQTIQLPTLPTLPCLLNFSLC